MALRLLVKPGEKIHFGTSNVIVVADQVVTVIIEGTMPVIRENDYLRESSVPTAARGAYLALQKIYLHNDVGAGGDDYFANVKALLDDLPAARDLVTQINGHLASNELYKALKAGRSVVQLDEHALSWADVINAG